MLRRKKICQLFAKIAKRQYLDFVLILFRENAYVILSYVTWIQIHIFLSQLAFFLVAYVGKCTIIERGVAASFLLFATIRDYTPFNYLINGGEMQVFSH
jgi:hypothetical protein